MYYTLLNIIMCMHNYTSKNLKHKTKLYICTYVYCLLNRPYLFNIFSVFYVYRIVRYYSTTCVTVLLQLQVELAAVVIQPSHEKTIYLQKLYYMFLTIKIQGTICSVPCRSIITPTANTKTYHKRSV